MPALAENATQALEYTSTALSNAFESVISSIESTCDYIAEYGGRFVSFIGKKTVSPRSAAAKKISELTRPFWNLTAGVFRYTLAPIAWHLPRQIVWLEGHSKLEENHPQYQRIKTLSDQMGISRLPKVFLKSDEAWQLPHGGWSGIFQPTLVVKASDSNGVIKRQLLATQLGETSIQMLNLTAIALSTGLLLTNFAAPYAPAAKLALILGGYLVSYIGTQIAVDRSAIKKLNDQEKLELKNELASIKACPLFDSSTPLLARIQSIPKALYLIPSYIRSTLV